MPQQRSLEVRNYQINHGAIKQQMGNTTHVKRIAGDTPYRNDNHRVPSNDHRSPNTDHLIPDPVSHDHSPANLPRTNQHNDIKYKQEISTKSPRVRQAPAWQKYFVMSEETGKQK